MPVSEEILLPYGLEDTVGLVSHCTQHEAVYRKQLSVLCEHLDINDLHTCSLDFTLSLPFFL